MSLEETEGECEYVTLPCRFNCGVEFFCCKLNDHFEECNLQPHTCNYCSDYSSTYYDVVNVHQLKCPDYPVSCPNSCKVINLKRCGIDEHCLVCPKAIMSCSFNDMGCKEEIKQQDLPEHLKTSTLQHQSMMCGAL